MTQPVIYVQYGQTGTLWDASFSMDQCEAVDVDFEAIHMISVEIDKGTGEVSLNRLYEADSDMGEAEERLFREYGEEIEDSLLAKVKSLGSDYEAFVNRRKGAPTP